MSAALSPPARPPSAARPARILVADDQPGVLEALRLLLKKEGFALHVVSSPVEILAAVTKEELDVVLMDLRFARDPAPGRDGLHLVGRLREADPSLSVVVMAGRGGLEGGVDVMRLGARDYVEKPWNGARLVATLRKEAEFAALLRRAHMLEVGASRERRRLLPEIVARAPSMTPVLRLLERIGPSSANVLVLGEHGAGKEVVARSLHALSDRAAKPFVAVDVGGLSVGAVETELFGHARGALPGGFALADGGTLFLDEIGTLPWSLQTKVLRVLQTGEIQPGDSPRTRRVDVRVVAATCTDIRREVAEGRFRHDLLAHLHAEVDVPPLRERREDVLPLAEHFLGQMAAKYGARAASFTSDAMRVLVEHAWPGNVRELEHVVERALLVARDRPITEEDLGVRTRPLLASPSSESPERGTEEETRTLDEVERAAIRRAIERAGNVTSAAVALGVSRSALYRRLQHHGIKGA